MTGPSTDHLGRLLPGSAPGGDYSWCLVERGVSHAEFNAMQPAERLALALRFSDAASRGRRPDVEGTLWLGPHHPTDPD